MLTLLIELYHCSKMYLLLIAIIPSLFVGSLCQQCPSIYLRYSKEHSSCKPRSPTCPIFKAGLSNADKDLILDLHNKYRSKVATGKEKLAGGMPEGADMMQMVWDNELETVAQRRAEQCIYEHDCSNCRRVENFSVGQNIAYREMQCKGSRNCPQNPVPDWTNVLKMLYDEVADFDKRYVNSMTFVPGKVYGHFTQMVWSRTWRIGCGFVAFKKGNGYRQFYVCNYGPGGNFVRQPMYRTGPPCSACPTNSCCGKSCTGANYEGLCRMNRNTEAPVYAPKENYIFHCDFRNSAGDCSVSVAGSKKWKLVPALGGPFTEIVLDGGETSTLMLTKPIRPKQSFCFVIKYRSGPNVAGQKVDNGAAVAFKRANSKPVTMNLPKGGNNLEFFQYSISLNWSRDTEVSISFSVPRGAPSQFFNIQLVSAKVGKC